MIEGKHDCCEAEAAATAVETEPAAAEDAAAGVAVEAEEDDSKAATRDNKEAKVPAGTAAEAPGGWKD